MATRTLTYEQLGRPVLCPNKCIQLFSMKNLFSLAAIFLSLLAFGCNNPHTKPVATTHTDSTADPLAPTTQPVAPETAHAVLPQVIDEAGNTEEDVLAGTHPVTLQWISWDKPGRVFIEKEGNGWYAIRGGQKERGRQLEIDGRIRMVNALELAFDGRIVMRGLQEISGQDSCVRTGPQTFLSTKGRKYWRLQQMLNCDGTTTDYIDIYMH